MSPDFVAMLSRFLKYAEPGQITAEASLSDLGLDSMQSIELLFAIEDDLGVSLPDEVLTESTFATAGSLWAAVCHAGGDRP
ncbi:phosphopantetheine-binding protein [Actinoplanes oblitus]|uniref:Phosphopantetheine-binding protein n=1 Tax=Actinoplanes oblitus TaxID=3040509 RepID=A0ABY8WSK9_9ACTN|nr:phosphopantetheine-binding protein [Actinoplanes oblitus]WIM99845.1 phosphopantetheine-binding protein [Actinoplanes oblitus]